MSKYSLRIISFCMTLIVVFINFCNIIFFWLFLILTSKLAPTELKFYLRHCHVPSYAALHYLPTVDAHC